jgi:hypothetical protein
MDRPLGVTVSSIVLCLIAAAHITASWVLLVEANKPAQGGWFPGLVTFFVHILVVVLLVMAVWGLATAVGLLRMRSWARYSTLTIGGCMLAFGSVYGLWTLRIALAVDFRSMYWPALAIGSGSAALGLTWLIYFAQRGVAEQFKPGNQRKYSREPDFATSMLNLSVSPAPPPHPSTPRDSDPAP